MSVIGKTDCCLRRTNLQKTADRRTTAKHTITTIYELLSELGVRFICLFGYSYSFFYTHCYMFLHDEGRGRRGK